MRASKSAVFLFELMIIILVFSLAAAICTQIFATSYNVSTQSRELTMSSINAQTVAEQFKAGNTDTEPLYFDNEWTVTNESGAYYIVALEKQTGSDNIRDANVNVYKKGSAEAIYSLHVKEYID